MALGINTESTGSGDIIPIAKYDARSGRLSRIDRTNTGAGWQTEQVDITNGFRAVFDMENTEVGWINFNTGGAPAFQLMPLDRENGGFPPKPGERYKQGFRVMLKLGKESGGDVRELCSVARVVIIGFNELDDEYLKGVKANAGKLPVVELKSTKPVVSGSASTKSTNYQPVFEIVGWVARPADLVFKPKAVPTAATAPAASPKPANVTPESIKAAMADADDFG